MLRERAECHSGQWLQLPRTAVGPDAFLPPPTSLPSRPARSASCREAAAHAATAQGHLGGCTGRDTGIRQDGIWPSSRSLGHPPPRESGLSQIAEKLSKSMSWTARNLQQKTQASPLLLLGVLGYQTCCVPLVFSRKAWVLTQVFFQLG